MGDKETYINILRRFVGFRLKREDYSSQINYNAAVTIVHVRTAEKYGLTKIAAAHLLAALGFQLLSEIEQEESISFVKDILDGREIPPCK